MTMRIKSISLRNYQRIATFFIILITSFFLMMSGCAFNYHYKFSQMGSVLVLKEPFFLREFKPKIYGFIPLNTRYELYPIGKVPVFSTFSPPRSKQEFLAKREYYQAGYGSFIGEERILGIVDANTSYKLLDQYTSTIDSHPFEYIEILEGPYRGLKGYLYLDKF